MAITKAQKFSVISRVFAEMDSNWVRTIGEETLSAKDIVDFCSHEMEMLSNRKRSTGKPSKTQQENEVLKTKILELLADGVARTATDVMVALELSSNQKASALLKQLVESGNVVKSTDKKKVTRFTIA